MVFQLPRVLTDPTAVPPGFHRGVRAMEWAVLGRVWEVTGRDPLGIILSGRLIRRWIPLRRHYSLKRYKKTFRRDLPDGLPHARPLGEGRRIRLKIGIPNSKTLLKLIWKIVLAFLAFLHFSILALWHFWTWTLSNICSRIVLFTEPRDYYYYGDYGQSRRNYNYTCKSDYKL